MKHGQVFYGVEWTELFAENLQSGQKPEDFGFIRVSSPKSKFRGYLGIKLLDIERLDKAINLKILTAQQPTKNDIKNVGILINKLPENLKILVNSLSISCLFY